MKAIEIEPGPTRDLRLETYGGLPICSLVPSWWWLWLIGNSPTEPKSRTLSLRKGPLCGRGNTRIDHCNGTGRAFGFEYFFAKIKSNMKATNRLRQRTARSAPWGSPLPLVKTKSGEPGSAVDRVGMVSQQRIALAATTS